MLKMGLLWNAEPKYSRLKKQEEYTNGETNKYKPVEVFEAFEVSDSKHVEKDPSGEYARLRSVAVAISWFSVIFGFTTGVCGICLGEILGSEALFGYGLDAVLDSMSSVAVLWRFYSNCTDEQAENKERKACIVISIFFYASSISLIFKSVRGFIKGSIDDLDETERIISDVFSSVCGIIALSTGLVKVYYGQKLQSRSLLTDSIITFVGAFMSFMSVLSMELHEYDNRIWYLDAASGLTCAVFLLIFGVKGLSSVCIGVMYERTL